MPNIKIDLIRPSPYQPRIHFELKTLKESIEKEGMLAVPIVREKPDKRTKYEMIDGERRWRTAKELGWNTIPIEIIDADDEKARRMVYTLNEERQPYTLEENTKFFRRMYDEMGSAYAVANAFRKHPSTVWQYINISLLPEHLQKAVWFHKITTGYIQEIEPVFTEARNEIGDIGIPINYDKSPSYQKIVAWCERIYTKEIQSTKELREEYVDPYLARLGKARIKKAKKVTQKAAPDKLIKAKIEMKTAEDFERAAKALKRKARELMTPEQKAREKRKKQIAQAKISLNATVKKIDKAGESLDVSRFSKRLDKIKNTLESDPVGAKDQLTALGKEVIAVKGAKKSLDATVKKIDDAEKILDVGGFRKRFNKIKSTLERDPTEAKDQLVALGKEVAEAKKQRQAELKEKARIKREEATKIKLKMEAEEKAKAELLKDKEFLRAVAEEAETVELLPEPEEKPPKERPIPPEELEEIQRRREEISKRMAAVFSKPGVKRRGKLLKNWLAHGAVADVAGSLFCPKCGKPHNNLQWVCDKIPVVKAYGLAGEEMDKEAKKRGKK